MQKFITSLIWVECTSKPFLPVQNHNDCTENIPAQNHDEHTENISAQNYNDPTEKAFNSISNEASTQYIMHTVH